MPSPRSRRPSFNTLSGQYRIDAKLGRGGMGIVWWATEMCAGRLRPAWFSKRDMDFML